MKKPKINKPKLLARLLEKRDWKSYALNLNSFISYRYWWRDFLINFASGADQPNSKPGRLLIRRPNLLAKYSNLIVNDLGDRMTANEIFCWECYKHKGKPGDTILDLGSNTGISANYFLSLDPQNKCMLIEPNKDLKGDIETNLSSFSPDRYEVKNLAIGPESGEGRLNQKDHSRYNQVIYSSAAQENVKIITLATAIKDCIDTWGSCDILKIDIEGYGFSSLDTIPKEFSFTPRTILIEEDYQSRLDLKWLRFHYTEHRHPSGIYRFQLKGINKH